MGGMRHGEREIMIYIYICTEIKRYRVERT